ncbi:hypothetical protein Sango_1268100 [Sesamum angolense]|uniref:Integrase catalytic domain-containing protein n=1 Tax=Sesamum angolense TaxID=2727404 RepID=A0AAE2BU79_9LAMI|nr:hypothetical protein Sango_1268100 [Sesamum angolense]
MGLEDLIVRLRIEEDNRLSEMKSGKLQIEAKANLMEQNGNTSIKRKRVDYKAKKGRAKIIKGNCYNCGKPNHMARIADFLRKIKRMFQSKDEALEAFKLYKNEVENQLSKTIKAIRSDRGGEYGTPFEEFCSEFGIIHQTTAPYSPQSNDIAERKNRTLKEMMNAVDKLAYPKFVERSNTFSKPHS